MILLMHKKRFCAIEISDLCPTLEIHIKILDLGTFSVLHMSNVDYKVNSQSSWQIQLVSMVCCRDVEMDPILHTTESRVDFVFCILYRLCIRLFGFHLLQVQAGLSPNNHMHPTLRDFRRLQKPIDAFEPMGRPMRFAPQHSRVRVARRYSRIPSPSTWSNIAVLCSFAFRMT